MHRSNPTLHVSRRHRLDRRPRRTGAARAALAAACLVGAGCAASAQPAAGGRSPRTAAPPVSTAALDRHYVIGPDAARALGYRIDWQESAASDRAARLRLVRPSHDSIFVLDDRNYLTRLRRDDGERLWRIPVADPAEEIQGITFVPQVERVYLTAGGSLLVLDASTGSVVGRQRFESAASTEPVRYGSFMIYGARNGQLVWHSFEIAFHWRSYQISRSIRLRPVLAGDYVVAVSTDGRVMVLLASAATQLWSKQLLDRVVARPVVGNGVVYLAGTDQYLYAFDLTQGRTLWSRLTTAPLVDGPTLIDDRVYQQVPGEGLTCFEALPLDAPGGVHRWVSPSVKGSVLTRHGENLLAWNESQGSMALLESSGGAPIRSVDLPQVAEIRATSVRDGNLIAASRDGRVIRLVPRN